MKEISHIFYSARNPLEFIRRIHLWRLQSISLLFDESKRSLFAWKRKQATSLECHEKKFLRFLDFNTRKKKKKENHFPISSYTHTRRKNVYARFQISFKSVCFYPWVKAQNRKIMYTCETYIKIYFQDVFSISSKTWEYKVRVCVCERAAQNWVSSINTFKR